jgi:muramoyltetrapeptide carboxypeptidase
MKFIRPPRLHPGDRVRVVAASGPVNRERFEAGVQALQGHYELSFDEESLFARSGFLAGADDHRLEAINTAISDPDCHAVFLARGGYGLTRILHGIDHISLRTHPKPIVGYSDVTALLSVCAHAGVAAIHGPMISDFALLEDRDRASLINLLENPTPGVLLSDLDELVPGQAQGPLLGGNLEVLSRLLGTPLQPDFRGAVLFLEEIGELPYRVDRLLTHLEAAGVFDSVAGIVIGDFTDCDEIEEGEIKLPTSLEVLNERLGRLQVPVVLNGGFGHGERKASLPYGVPVQLDTAAGELIALEGAVS